MIIKSFQLNKTNIERFNFFLFYGPNSGLQNEIIENFFAKRFEEVINKYDENEIIKNREIILSEMMSKSLFDNKKIYIISRVSEKILNFMLEILEKKIDGVKIIIKSKSLDKRSKLRTFFEKDKLLATIPVYEDTPQDLSKIIVKFLNENKIKLSMESINLLISRARGDRDNIKNELNKILSYSFTEKSLSLETVKRLSNLSENFSVNELVDNYLSKKTRSVVKVLNENNYTNEDCILIIRTILNRSKRLMNILENYNENGNLDVIISNVKPPIFWKEKEGVKKQANSWTLNELKNKIYELNKIEMLIKTNSNNSLNILSNFIVNY